MTPRWPLAFIAAGVLLGAAGHAAAQVVVLFARGPSAAVYPAGRVLPATQVLNLKAGDQVELLDGSGSHVVTGPAVVTAGALAPKVRDELIGVFLKAQRSRPGIAASRGFDAGPPGPPSLWQADLMADGAVCVEPGVAPTLWRDPTGPSGTVGVTRVATGRTVTMSVPPDGAPWPGDMPTTDGERYVVTLSDGSTTSLSWKVIDPAPTDLAALAAALADRACYDQLGRVQSAFAAE